MDSAPSAASNSLSITHLVSCLSPNLPTNFSDESPKKPPEVSLATASTIVYRGANGLLGPCGTVPKLTYVKQKGHGGPVARGATAAVQIRRGLSDWLSLEHDHFNIPIGQKERAFLAVHDVRTTERNESAQGFTISTKNDVRLSHVTVFL